MPVYEYTALDKRGKNQNGIIDADSPIMARQKLRGSGVYPIEVKETTEKSRVSASSPIRFSTLFRRVKPSELSATTRQLSILLGAGIPLVGSLDALQAQIENPLLKRIMAEVKDSVNEGNSLAQALSRHPKVFSQIFINMIRAGEASGSLDVVLDRLAEYLEKQQALRSRIQAALAYPIIMLCIAILVLYVLLTYVLPKISGIFQDLGQALPLPTIIILGISNFMKNFWWALIIVFVLIIIILRQLIKTKKGRAIWDEIKLRFPILGSVNRKLALARFGRTLGSLLQSGVPLITSLQIVHNIVNNVLVAQAIDQTMDEIQTGKSLAAPLSKSRWFPPVTIQMINVGEQSGDLEKMLHKIADIYEQETESYIMTLMSVLEPILILFMAGIVFFIIISIVLPITEMNQLIR